MADGKRPTDTRGNRPAGGYSGTGSNSPRRVQQSPQRRRKKVSFWTKLGRVLDYIGDCIGEALAKGLKKLIKGIKNIIREIQKNKAARERLARSKASQRAEVGETKASRGTAPKKSVSRKNVGVSSSKPSRPSSKKRPAKKPSVVAKLLAAVSQKFAEIRGAVKAWFDKQFPDFAQKQKARAEKRRSRLRSSSRGGDIAAKAIVAIFCVAAAGFILYQIYFYLYSGIETQTVMRVTISDTIETTGIAVRDESIITGDVSGVVVSTIDNGGKVGKGEAIAEVYTSTEAAQAAQRIAEIDMILEDFESMSTAGEDSASELSSLEKQLSERLLALSKNVYGGNVGDACDLSDDILYLLNKSQIATKATDGFDERVAELKAERESLAAKYGETPQTLNSTIPGYYINMIDGYEELLRSDMLETLSPEALDGILSQYRESADETVIGKIADDYIWHIVCEVTTEQAEKFEQGRSYKLYMPYSDIESVSAQLVRINGGKDKDRSLLIFRCTYMVSDL
ncbi:MAG: hypothetical protein IJC18_05510, partial [Clostridia bacterium]|nr:hypothetical protein [Clostridia bacterium]